MTVAEGFETADFTLAGGAISQPYTSSGTDITVTHALTWTGGPLNSSANLANVTLTGGTGLIAPENAGTIATGSNLLLAGTSSTTFAVGTVQVNNSAGVTAKDGSNVNIATGNSNGGGSTVVKFDNPNAVTYVNTEMILAGTATVTVSGTGTWRGNNFQLRNTGGTLDILGGTTVQFGYVGTATFQLKWDVLQESGTTRLHAGAILTPLSSPVRLAGGNFVVVVDSSQGGSVTALLNGKLEVDGASTVISFESPPASWYAPGTQRMGIFMVNGDVTWNRGVVKPRVNVASAGDNDVWQIEGTLSLQSADASVQAVFYNAGGGLNVNDRWAVIKINGGIAPPPATQNPTKLASNAAYNLYKVQKAGTVVWFEVGS